MAVSVKARFDVFKRDDFTCKYCGRKSPEVVLEVDHVVPKKSGGTDDPINLATSCWDCNRGKTSIPLDNIITSVDPHIAAIEMLNKRRELEEYNILMADEDATREDDAWALIDYWNEQQCREAPEGGHKVPVRDYRWLKSALRDCPREQIRRFMDIALGYGYTKDFRYVGGCVRNWRQSQTEAANGAHS